MSIYLRAVCRNAAIQAATCVCHRQVWRGPPHRFVFNRSTFARLRPFAFRHSTPDVILVCFEGPNGQPPQVTAFHRGTFLCFGSWNLKPRPKSARATEALSPLPLAAARSRLGLGPLLSPRDYCTSWRGLCYSATPIIRTKRARISTGALSIVSMPFPTEEFAYRLR
jgi:hypothetical protein